jgi:hypothetical protein
MRRIVASIVSAGLVTLLVGCRSAAQVVMGAIATTRNPGTAHLSGTIESGGDTAHLDGSVEIPCSAGNHG